MNPYELPAEPFLLLYLLLFALCLGFAVYERNRGRPGPAPRAEGLDPVSLGYLAGGAGRALDVAIVGLLHAQAAICYNESRTIGVNDRDAELPGYLRPFASRLGLPRPVSAVKADFRLDLDRTRAALAARGLAYESRDGARIAFQSAVPMLTLVVFGAVRVYLGNERKHPVGYITFLTLAALAVAIALMARQVIQRPAAKAAIETSRQAGSRLLRAPLPDELAVATALGGLTALYGTHLHHYARMRQAAGNGGGSGCGGSGCGGGGGGGGCGGCGC